MVATTNDLSKGTTVGAAVSKEPPRLNCRALCKLRSRVGFIVLCIGLLSVSLALSSCAPATDRSLQERFFSHQEDFQKLLDMYQQDAHLVTIAPDYTLLDTDGSWPRKNIGISPERWQQYRQLFSELGLSGGVGRTDDYPGAIYFLVSARGFVAPSPSSYKGYFYSPNPPTPLLEFA